jgi:hypothetical protein
MPNVIKIVIFKREVWIVEWVVGNQITPSLLKIFYFQLYAGFFSLVSS